MISIRIENSTIPSLLEKLDSLSGIDIYFRTEDFTDIKKTFTWKQESLENALAQVMEGTDLIAVPYRNYACVIMPRTALDRSNLTKYYDNLQRSLEEKPSVRTNVIGIGSMGALDASGEVLLSGQVIEQFGNDPIIGANILFGKGIGTTSDENGQFEIRLKPGVREIRVKYLGYQDHIATLDLRSNGQYDVILVKETINLDEVTITAVAKDAAVRETQTGVARINLRNLDKLPTFLGERDIVRAVLLNPGVSTIGEGATGFNVRGGNVDHNLVIQDEAILFNASHALGFFSTFNADLIKEAALSKGNIPASQGGRIASVLEVNLKDGNKEKMRYRASVNPISATFSLDGPLGKNSTIIGGARATYSDYIFGLFQDVSLRTSSASFYDVNFKYSYRKNGHHAGVGIYASNDQFTYGREFGFGYKTNMIQAFWNKLINDKLSNRLSVVASSYKSFQIDLTPAFESRLSADIQYLRAVNKLSAIFGKSKLDVGINAIYYTSAPGSITPQNGSPFVIPASLPNEYGLESAVFINLERPLGKYLDFITGFRLNHFAALGTKKVYLYKNGRPNEEEISGTEDRKGLYQSYIQPEPRVSLKLNLGKSSSLKIGYARTSQFINQVFNTDTPTPSSQWQLVNNYLKPTLSDNLSIGLFRNFDDDNIEASVEFYRREIGRLYDFRDFAKIVVNPHIETELLEGIGRSQGMELSLKKNEGKWTGWASYTWSDSRQKVEGINDGNWYNSSFDKPHNLSLIVNFQPIQRHTLTANFTYSTGRPSTAPLSNYLTPDNVYVPVYSQRNQIRIPDYHRLDLSYNIARSHNQAAKVITSWTVTLYNVYGRKNPFSVYYTRGLNSTPQANRLAVVGTIFPAIRFNIEFL
ncbi:MAG: TonB-dependent receptor [Saprospiraceae bacterium]|nr:TonB-dependent receptor [Saprospiraceae bacterium]